MTASRFFWKLVLTCAGLNVVGAAVLGVALGGYLQGRVADVDAVRRWIALAVAVESLAVFVLCYWLVGWLTGPVATLNEAASAIAAGDYRQRIYAASRDELGTLAATLNDLRQSLGARMSLLSETVARQSTVLGGMTEGVIAVDARQRVVLANEAAGRLFGFHPPAVEGRPLLEVLRNHSVYATVAAGLETGVPQRMELARIGVQKWSIDIHVQPLPGEPCPGLVLVLRDTSELRRLESIRRDFVANVSHELKTPLSSIKAYTETLRNGAITDAKTSERFLARIEEQADRLHHLIMDMLVLARIESEQQAFDIVSIEVPAVVAASLDDYRAAAEAKRISLSVPPHAETAEACRVRADREGLRQILDNLLDNAVKYTPVGGRVSVDWRTNGTMTYISVRDTGIGIGAADRERIFERFYRVDKARSRELGGTGLGLSIVKHLAQSFGGTVNVESEPEQGSTFTVELPSG